MHPAIRKSTLLFGFLLGLVCCSAHAPSPFSVDGLPALDSKPVYPNPIEEAPDHVQSAWQKTIDSYVPLSTYLARHGQAEGDGWQGGKLIADWVKMRVQAISTVTDELSTWQNPSDAEQFFAAIIYAELFGDLASEIRSSSQDSRMLPPKIANDPNLKKAFQTELNRTAIKLEKRALLGYQRCTKWITGVGPAVAAWRDICQMRAAEIGALTRREREKPRTLPECKEQAPSSTPAAPPPNDEEPMELALTFNPDQKSPAATWTQEQRSAFVDKISSTISEALERRDGKGKIAMPQVPLDEVRRAQILVDQRKHTEDGPVCGQGPTLEEILSQRHKNLVTARVTVSCNEKCDWDEKSRRSICNKEEQECDLHIYFNRPGLVWSDTNYRGVPQTISRHLGLAPVAFEDWLAAAHLDKSPPPVGLLGMIMGGGGLGMRGKGVRIRIAGVDESQERLRVGPTFWGLNSKFEDCYKKHRGDSHTQSSFQVSTTVSEVGEVLNTIVEPKTVGVRFKDVPGFQQCAAEAIQESVWPCTTSGNPETVTATICTWESK